VEPLLAKGLRRLDSVSAGRVSLWCLLWQFTVCQRTAGYRST